MPNTYDILKTPLTTDLVDMSIEEWGNEYERRLKECRKFNLNYDDCDAVIFGERTLEDVLKHPVETPLEEDLLAENIFVEFETEEELKAILDTCNKVAKERLEKGIY